MGLKDVDERFRKLHSGNVQKIDASLDRQARAARVPSEDPTVAKAIDKIPLELHWLLPDPVDDDFSTAPDPLEKFAEQTRLELLLGEKPTMPSRADLGFSALHRVLAGADDETETVLDGRVVSRNDDGLEKSAGSGGAIQKWVFRLLEKGASKQEIRDMVTSGGASEANIEIVESALATA